MNFKPIIRKTILTCLKSMVSYHLSIVFIIFYSKSNGKKNIPIEAKNIVHATDKHPNDYVLSCNIRITLYCNTRTKIYLYPNISYESKSMILITMMININIFSNNSYLFFSIILYAQNCLLNEKTWINQPII